MNYIRVLIQHFVIFLIFSNLRGMQNNVACIDQKKKISNNNLVTALRLREMGLKSWIQKLPVSVLLETIDSQTDATFEDERIVLIFQEHNDKIGDYVWDKFTQELKEFDFSSMYITEWSRTQAQAITLFPRYLDRLMAKVSDFQEAQRLFIAEELFESVCWAMARAHDEKSDDVLAAALRTFTTVDQFDVNYYDDNTSLLHYLADSKREKFFFPGSKDISLKRKQVLIKNLLTLGANPCSKESDTGLSVRELFLKTSLPVFDDPEFVEYKKQILALLPE